MAYAIRYFMLWDRNDVDHFCYLRSIKIRSRGCAFLSSSGRYADCGRNDYNDGPVLRAIYDQMLEPKWVIAMGACSSSGGIFDTYSVLQGIDEIMPVDVYVPGCPPIPEGLLYAIMHLQKKIQNGEDRVPAERPTQEDAMNAMSYRKGVGYDIKANFVVTPEHVNEFKVNSQTKIPTDGR